MRFVVLLLPLVMVFLSWLWWRQVPSSASRFAVYAAGVLILVVAVRMVFS